MSYTDINRTDTLEGYETDSVETALDAIRRGQLIIVSDDEGRENEGDLVMAGVRHAARDQLHGHACPRPDLHPDHARAGGEFELEPMTANNTESHGTAFTVSVDGGPEDGVTTGISAYDRAKTIDLIVRGKASQLRRPGHIFPLVAKPGGLLERDGHTETAVDLARMAGLEPVGVIVEILNEDGTMARFPDLVEFARKHQLVFTTVEKIRQYRMEQEGVAA